MQERVTSRRGWKDGFRGGDRRLWVVETADSKPLKLEKVWAVRGMGPSQGRTETRKVKW